ncbi:MAG: hypothetical protein U0168_09750 [Nannocystaceae bacterium]
MRRSRVTSTSGITIGMGCALDALGEVGGGVEGPTDDLTASANAFVEVSGAVGAGG